MCLAPDTLAHGLFSFSGSLPVRSVQLWPSISHSTIILLTDQYAHAKTSDYDCLFLTNIYRNSRVWVTEWSEFYCFVFTTEWKSRPVIHFRQTQPWILACFGFISRFDRNTLLMLSRVLRLLSTLNTHRNAFHSNIPFVCLALKSHHDIIAHARQP